VSAVALSRCITPAALVTSRALVGSSASELGGLACQSVDQFVEGGVAGHEVAGGAELGDHPLCFGGPSVAEQFPGYGSSQHQHEGVAIGSGDSAEAEEVVRGLVPVEDLPAWPGDVRRLCHGVHDTADVVGNLGLGRVAVGVRGEGAEVGVFCVGEAKGAGERVECFG